MKKIFLIILVCITLVSYFLRNNFNTDYISILSFWSFLLLIFSYDMNFIAKYLHMHFWSIGSTTGIFICENANIYLEEMGVNSAHFGSLTLVLLFFEIFYFILLILDRKYYNENTELKCCYFNKKIEALFDKFILIIMFLYGLILFLYVLPNPSFELKLEKFAYKELYLNDYFLKLQNLYLYICPIVIIPFIKLKNLKLKHIFLISFIFCPFLLYAIWTGHKFGLIFSLICIVFVPIYVIFEFKKLSIQKNIIFCTSIFLVLSFILFFFYSSRNYQNIISVFIQRIAQQGQLWWSVYHCDKDNGWHINEIGDEIEPILNKALGYDFSPDLMEYGIYKLMWNFVPKKELVRKRLLYGNGGRYSAQGVEMAFYYMKYTGLFIFAFLSAGLFYILINSFINYIKSRRIIEMIITVRFIDIIPGACFQGDWYYLVSKVSILSFILLVVLEILHRKKFKENFNYENLSGNTSKSRI